MYPQSSRKNKRPSLLHRYSAELAQNVDRNIAQTALVAAKEAAEKSADVAHSAMLEAQTSSRAKTEFLANISHELRTPLNAIIGFSDIMRHQKLIVSDPEKFQEYANDIHESAIHLLDLINDILDLSKIEASKLELNEQVIDVPKVVASCITVIRERAQEGGLSLKDDVPADLPGLYGDERKLKQILINLLSNAVKFTLEGGGVTVTVEAGPEIGFIFRVADTGIGIAAEDLEKALAPFGQVDSKLARRYEGTGLGLPLTAALVDLHGGTLDIDSAVGKGTTVTITFPSSRIARAAA